jgi:hypothetical protein
MPISGAAMAALIQLQMTAKGMTGQYVMKLSQAIGSGVVSSILASAIYNGTSTGLTIGAGASTGKLAAGVTIGTVVGNMIYLQMTAAGLRGEYAQKLASAIGAGVAKHMATAMVQGASTIVAIGSGTGTIKGVVGSSMGALIFAQMGAKGMTGQYAQKLASAIGKGVANSIKQTIVTTTITGIAIGPIPPVFPPVPGTGVDTGKIV